MVLTLLAGSIEIERSGKMVHDVVRTLLSHGGPSPFNVAKANHDLDFIGHKITMSSQGNRVRPTDLASWREKN